MLENKDKEDKKASTTTTSPTPSKSKVNKIEVLKKSLKENNIPKKSNVKSQNKDNTPKKSDVKVRMIKEVQRGRFWFTLILLLMIGLTF